MSRICQLLGSAQLTDSAAAIVTNPVGYDTCITNIAIHNTHSAALTVTLYLVPDNASSVGTAGATNQIFLQSVDAYDTVLLGREDLGWWMNDTNDTLQAVAGTAAKVNVFVHGVQQTTQA